MTHKDYVFQPLDLSVKGLTEVIELFRVSFGTSSPDVHTLEWQYLKNPLGKAVGFNAFLGEQLAAHYVTIPTQAKVHGKLQIGLLSLNTATHPQHQKRGLFTKLAEMTYRAGHSQGSKFVVGVANHNSVHGFTKKLGFQNVGLLQSRIFLRSPNFQEKELDFGTEWNLPFLQWRLSRPGATYLYNNSKNKSEIFYEHPKFHMKVLVQNVSNDIKPDFVNQRSWRRNPFLYWMGVDSRLDWSKSLSLEVPQKFKKIPLNLIFRDLQSDKKISFDKTAFYALDFDAY